LAAKAHYLVLHDFDLASEASENNHGVVLDGNDCALNTGTVFELDAVGKDGRYTDGEAQGGNL